MGYTKQQGTLGKLRDLYGRDVYTEDHLDYRRVGCVVDGKTYSAVADTWEEAIERLKGKVNA